MYTVVKMDRRDRGKGYEKPNKHRTCYYCGSSPSLQKAPHVCDLSIKDVKGWFLNEHPLTSLMDRSHACGAFCSDGEEPQ